MNRETRQAQFAPFDFHWIYDAAGNRTSQDLNGAVTIYSYDHDLAITALTNPQEAQTYTNDASGRLVRRQRLFNNQREDLQFAYTALGQMKSVKVWNGNAYAPRGAYTYDAQGRVATQQREYPNVAIDEGRWYLSAWDLNNDGSFGDGIIAHEAEEAVVGNMCGGWQYSDYFDEFRGSLSIGLNWTGDGSTSQWPILGAWSRVDSVRNGEHNTKLATWGQGSLFRVSDDNPVGVMYPTTDGMGNQRGSTNAQGAPNASAFVYNSFGQLMGNQGTLPSTAFHAEQGWRREPEYVAVLYLTSGSTSFYDQTLGRSLSHGSAISNHLEVDLDWSANVHDDGEIFAFEDMRDGMLSSILGTTFGGYGPSTAVWTGREMWAYNPKEPMIDINYP